METVESLDIAEKVIGRVIDTAAIENRTGFFIINVAYLNSSA